MAEIRLLRGQAALIDDEDLLKIAGYRWLLSAKGYVVAMLGPRNKRKAVWLHRLVAGTPNGFDTDHRNRNKLDCRKQNLRPATRRQNTGNRVKQINGKASTFKGVTWHAQGKGYWRARFRYRDAKAKAHSNHLGLFADETEAARAYDRAAMAHFGEAFALLNFP